MTSSYQPWMKPSKLRDESGALEDLLMAMFWPTYANLFVPCRKMRVQNYYIDDPNYPFIGSSYSLCVVVPGALVSPPLGNFSKLIVPLELKHITSGRLSPANALHKVPRQHYFTSALSTLYIQGGPSGQVVHYLLLTSKHKSSVTELHPYTKIQISI